MICNLPTDRFRVENDYLAAFGEKAESQNLKQLWKRQVIDIKDLKRWRIEHYSL